MSCSALNKGVADIAIGWYGKHITFEGCLSFVSSVLSIYIKLLTFP